VSKEKGEVFMSYNHDDAFTGLEAAIVLIAFVVVAAVFSYVVLGAGFFTTQKSQETVYKGVEQATSNIQMLGQVYGIDSAATSDNAINVIQFTIGLAPGAPSVDLEAMTIIFSAPDVAPITYSQGTAAADNQEFSTEDQTGTPVTTMASGDQIKVTLFTGVDNERLKGDKINIELRPGVGAALPFTKTMPATVSAVNILY
jgi:flagellin FlaB